MIVKKLPYPIPFSAPVITTPLELSRHRRPRDPHYIDPPGDRQEGSNCKHPLTANIPSPTSLNLWGKALSFRHCLSDSATGQLELFGQN
ncbi:hypothetical protein MLD38_038753 [Melastoma candidum]|uniref:Uncharacterized protein n=1 Tax=Melastoma candidum TaxID=119954 RepID=A0ACB9L0R3_9MYRT|nr:hypothetical protein MLD38_038753 [Melastoma candidum]